MILFHFAHFPQLHSVKDNDDDDSDNEEEEPTKDADCQEDDEGEPKNTRPKKKKEDPIIVRFKDPRSKKKEKQKKRRSSRLQQSSVKVRVTRSPHILTPSQQRVMGMKTRGKKLSYSHRYAMVTDHVLTHYSVKAGIKKFGDAGSIAVSDELQQLHTKDTFTPVKATTLSSEQKKRALRLPMELGEITR